jgi:hypothetical protein
MMDLLFRPFGAFIAQPFLALLVGVGFAAAHVLARRGAILAAAIAWMLYGVYEYGNFLRITCAGECNIRVDMFLIAPLLAAVSVGAIVSASRALVKAPRR